MREMRQDPIIGPWMNRTIGHRFRGEQPGETIIPFLQNSYIVEMHTESVMKSFFLGRVDADNNGIWSPEERHKAVEFIEAENKAYLQIFEQQPRGFTLGALDMNKGMRDIGIGGPAETTYIWTSSDGAAYQVRPKSGSVDSEEYYRASGSLATRRPCTFAVNHCLGPAWAYENTEMLLADYSSIRKSAECFTCLQAILVNASKRDNKRGGYSAALPPKTDPRRKYFVNSIRRYSYAVGYSYYDFFMYRTIEQANKKFDRWSRSPLPYMCINDDIISNEESYIQKADSILHSYFKGAFSEPGLYENDV